MKTVSEFLKECTDESNQAFTDEQVINFTKAYLDYYLQNTWKDAKKEFPPFDTKVLVYYTIETPTGDGFYEYYEVASLESLTENSSGKYGSWSDCINPLLWKYIDKPSRTVK